MPPEDKNGIWYACPCCDKEFAFSQRRDQHVLDDHLEPDPLWTSLAARGMARCWCGRAVWQGDQFYRHLEEHGGANAHYIACLLGID